jgi:integrase
MFSLLFSLNRDFTMPSLWKRPASPYWFCCYTTADGQRLKKSTKQTDRKKAWEVCLSIDRAEQFAKNGTLTEQTAKKIIGEIVERATGEPLHNMAANEWFADWVAGKAEVKSKTTAERYKQVARDFLGSLGQRQTLSLMHVTSKDIRAYRNSELVLGKSNKTANISVKIVSAAFNAALRQGYITMNPCTAIEALPEQTADRSNFTPKQVAKLVGSAEGDWQGAILFAYYTGARLSDVANMRWNAINLGDRVIEFGPKKTRKPVVIPFHSDLERHLLKSPGVGRAFLFPSLAEKRTGGKNGLSGQFKAIMVKAEIKGKVIRHTTEGRANTSLSFHSLRHSFNSVMANAGVSQEIRQKLTGHASAEMNTIYTHHELEPLRAAIARIPAVGV